MQHIFLGLLGVAVSILMIKYREKIGSTIGDAEWMKWVGGNYNLVILIAIFIFFWSIAEMTGTTNILLMPLKFLIPTGLETPSTPF